MRRLFGVGLVLASVLAMTQTVGCGDDGTGGSGGTGAGGGGGAGPNPACENVDTTGCTVSLGPTDDDTTTVQTALIEANSNDVVCLCPGTYSFENQLSVTTPNLTVRGVGATRADVVLDFAEQTGGDDAFIATSDGFTVENFTLKNSPGNGIVVTKADDVTFRNLSVSWDAGSVTENGAYAVYPVGCNNVIVEDCEVIGAADAGIYVGQSTNIIVRNNVVFGNVAGIEIENSNDAEVYNNEAYDNTAGILVFALPNLEKKDSLRCDVYDNTIYENNRDNFGDPGTTVGAVPPGIGVLILAADDTHIHDNVIRDNKTGGVVMVSYDTLEFLLSDPGEPDPGTDRDPERTYIYANTFTNNGYDPAAPLNNIPLTPLESVLWDGDEKTPGSAELCLSMTPPTFRNINGVPNIGNPAAQSTDPTPHLCDQAPLPDVDL